MSVLVEKNSSLSQLSGRAKHFGHKKDVFWTRKWSMRSCLLLQPASSRHSRNYKFLHFCMSFTGQTGRFPLGGTELLSLDCGALPASSHPALLYQMNSKQKICFQLLKIWPKKKCARQQSINIIVTIFFKKMIQLRVLKFDIYGLHAIFFKNDI